MQRSESCVRFVTAISRSASHAAALTAGTANALMDSRPDSRRRSPLVRSASFGVHVVPLLDPINRDQLTDASAPAPTTQLCRSSAVQPGSGAEVHWAGRGERSNAFGSRRRADVDPVGHRRSTWVAVTNASQTRNSHDAHPLYWRAGRRDSAAPVGLACGTLRMTVPTASGH